MDGRRAPSQRNELRCFDSAFRGGERCPDTTNSAAVHNILEHCRYIQCPQLLISNIAAVDINLSHGTVRGLATNNKRSRRRRPEVRQVSRVAFSCPASDVIVALHAL